MLLLNVFQWSENSYAQLQKRFIDSNTIEYFNYPQRINPSKQPTIPKKYNLSNNPYDSLIKSICKEENIDPELIRCIIKVESNFNKDAVSVAGAMGLMQIMQEIAQLYNIEDPFDPEQNIRAGVKHLKFLLSAFNGDLTLALAAYHAGIGMVKKNMRIPNISSTIEYVKKVLNLYNQNSNRIYTIDNYKLQLLIDSNGIIHITTQ